MRKDLFSGYPHGMPVESVSAQANQKFSRMRDGLKYVATLIAFISCFSGAFAQTVLINPATDGGFEQGATFAANGWTAVNATTDQWIVGGTPTASAGTNCGFVSANGTAWTYSQTGTILHIYKDVTIPANQPKITLSFKWKVGGEGTTTSDWDNMKVFVTPTSVTPVQGTAVAATYQVSGPGAINGMYKLSSASYNSETMVLTGVPGTTYRLIFSWKSDGSDIVNPPAAIDEVSVVSSAPGNFISIATGNWSSPLTWDANAVPTALDTIIVTSGHIVTLDGTSRSAAKATVNGTLTFASAPTAFTVGGNLTVGVGGLLEAFNGTTGKTLNVAGNLTNNGTIDLSKTSALLNLNGSVAQTVGGTGTFTASTITGLTFNNSNAVPTINWNFNNISIAGTLTFTKGWVNLGSNNLILGTSATTLGTLSYTAGGITAGTFGRWVSAASTGTAITAGATPTSATSRYPFIDATGANRSIWIERVGPTAAGIQAFTYSNGTTMSPVTVTDGAYNITSRFGSSWTFSTLATSPAAATYKLAITAPGGYLALNGNSRIMLAAAAAAGTHQNGTTAPTAQRTGLTMTDLTAGAFYLGIDDVDVPFLSIASGDWNSPSTWNKGIAPVCGDLVNIVNGHNVTVNSAANVAKSVAIATGGTLTVASGDLTIGCTLNNNTLAINGTLTVTGGTLNVNGSISMPSGGTFNQSAGNINVDGNAGGVTANSVASGTRIISLFPATLTNVNFTGGTLTIVDPHAGATATGSEALFVNTGTVFGTLNVTSAHTIRFGNGVSAEAGGYANGFFINTWEGNGGMVLGNVIVEGPTGTNRLVVGNYQQPISGNLTVNGGGHFAIASTYVNGNINVNTGGMITSSTTMGLLNSTFDPAAIQMIFAASTNAQTVTNNGTIRNATTPTANFTALVVNNSNTTGVTLNSPISASGGLTLTAGKVNTTATNILRLGTPTAAGTLTGGSATAYIDGPFARTFASSRTATGTYTVATLFPVGKGASYLPVYVDPTTSSAGPVIVSGEAFTSNAGTMAAGTTTLSSNRWETLILSGSANLTSSNIRLLDGAAMTAASKIVQAPSAAGAYSAIIPASTYAAGTPNTLTTASQILAANFTGYFAYGELVPCVAPTAQPTAFVAANVGTTTFGGSFTAATADSYLVVRYPAGSTPTAPADFTVYNVGGTLGTAPNLGTIVSTGSATNFNQTGLTASTTYDYYVYSYNNLNCAAPVYNTTSPLTSSVTTCATAVGAPGTPAGSAVTTTGFTATWTASSTVGATYVVDVATNNTFTNFVPGYNGLNVGTSLSTPIAGLTANTVYYVRVRAVNGSCTSVASSTLTQSTACNPVISFPWTESFNASTLPSCWSNQAVSGTPVWTFVTANGNSTITPRTGTHMAEFRTTAVGNKALLISPTLDLTSLTSPQLTYYYANVNWAGDLDSMTVYYKAAPADPWTVLVPKTNAENTTWKKVELLLPNPSATYSIAFEGISGWARGMNLDDVSVQEAPPCITPTDVNITNLAANTVTINWTASVSSPADGYEYEIRTSGAAGSGTTGLATSGTTAAGSVTKNITGLAENTAYSVYVRSNCGLGLYSSWTTSLNFTTPCLPYAVPYFEGFESGYTHNAVVAGCVNQQSIAEADKWTANNTLTDYNRTPRTGNWNSFLKYGNEDWMYIAVQLVGGTSYNMDLYARQDGSTAANASITVSYGTTAVNTAMTNAIIPQTGIINGNYQLLAGQFTPATSGIYYVGIRGLINSSPWYISVDDIAIYETPDPVITNVASTVTCGTSTNVTITGTDLNNATLTIGGAPITILSNTNTQITATVSSTATGTLTVTTPGGTTNAATAFSFTLAPAITLSTSSIATCAGTATSTVNVTTGAADYTTYTWTPSTGVTGDETSGWSFNPAATTTYSLAVSSGVTGCSNTAQVMVTVNILPSALTVTPANGETCPDDVLTLNTSGGLLQNMVVFSEDFNGTAAGWVTGNNTTGTNAAATAWTLRPEGYTVAGTSTYGPWSSNDDSQFMLTDSDQGGNGSITYTTLTSPSFSTASLTAANLNFYHHYRRNAAADSIMIFYSIDNGTSWTRFFYNNATVGDYTAFANANVALPAATLNQSNVKLRFAFRSAWGYTWAIDNVKVLGDAPSTISWAPATNLYTDAAATTAYVSGANASTVYVKSATPGTLTYTATATNAVTSCSTTSNTASVLIKTPTTSTITETACGSFTLGGSTFTTSGTHTVVIQNVAGCDSTITLNLTINPLSPAVTLSADQEICAGGTIAPFTATLGSGTIGTVTWYSDAALTDEVGTGVSFTSDETAAGVYTYYAVHNNGGCDSQPVIATLTINATPTAPVVTPSGAAAICAGEELTLTSSVTSGILWSNNATSASIDVSASGNYSVVYTDANGCTATSNVVAVTVNTVTAPVVTPNGPVAICQGSTATLTSSATTGIVWSNTATTASINVSAAGTYSVTYTDPTTGCTATSNAVTVTVNAVPVATVAISNDITIVASPAGQSYQWINCAGNTHIAGATSATFTATVNGSYKVIVTNANGCADTSACINVTKVGLEDLNADLGISLYPNPTNGDVYVTMTSTEAADVTVYDAQGKVVSVMSNVQNGAVIDLNKFEMGIYMIKVANPIGSNIFRIVKN